MGNGMKKFRANVEPTFWTKFAPRQRRVLVDGEIVRLDALSLLRRIRSETADLVFLDPPFNLGKSYGAEGPQDDLRSETEYFRFLSQIIKRAIRILKPGGSLFLYHLPKWAIAISPLLAQQLQFRHWIAVSMKNGFARGCSLYPAHYALLYFSKGAPSHFNRPKIPAARCRHCGDYVRDYGGYERYIRQGVNLSDVWDDLSPVRHRKRKNREANELPMELARRVVAIAGFRGGIIVDPFAGAGSTVVAAREAGMWFIAGDKESSNCMLIERRLANTVAPGEGTRATGA
jgi:site-specific DNA-methyltransferase (adenine-specific)